MDVRAILEEKGTTVITIHDDAPIDGAVAIMRRKEIGSLVVLDRDDGVVGMITERDIVRGLDDHGPAALSLHVRDLMTTHVFTCRPHNQLSEVMAWMTRHRVRHLPVISGDRLAGIISIGDVVHHRIEEVEAEASVLRDLYMASH